MAGVYRWKPGAAVRVDAQVAGAVLDRLQTVNNGRLTPDMVVAEAQPKTSPLHDHFEWNDSRAAKKYRLDQASYLIRSIEVVQVKPEQTNPTRAFVSVVRGEDRSYTTMAHALSDDEMRAQVLAEALNALEAWRRRYAELNELADIFAVIDEARPAK